VWGGRSFSGGRSVARILVADDNSNIQKMVGLALKDQGIDVIAVGNGEAAVRKISDIRPDLVLADVFMPVRNGYEVCKYVKDDPSLAHIPVILLVGAFDPLDEQEAQRVGADGVLKKPFVPPDPLISMVKSALMRASSMQAAAVAEKTPVAAMVGTPAAVASAASTKFAMPKEEAPAESASFVDEIPARPETLNIESSGKPMAFGSLMEAPVAEVEEAAYVAPVNPELADRDWDSEEEAEEEEEESESAAWRRDGGSEDFAEEPAGATEKSAARAKRRENWTPTREKAQDLLEAAVAPESTPAPVYSAPMSIPAAPAAKDSWAAPKAAEPAIVEQKVVEEFVSGPAPSEAVAPEVVSSTEGASAESAKGNAGSAWFSTSSSPWEAEAQKANQLASTWDAPGTPAVSEKAAEPEKSVHAESGMPEDFVSEEPGIASVSYEPEPGLLRNEVVVSSPLPDLISDGAISPETVESIRQETTYALESVAPPVRKESKVNSAQPDMDALVANVLAKMSPEMLQAVTREILKPVVAAMIREEINAKKS